MTERSACCIEHMYVQMCIYVFRYIAQNLLYDKVLYEKVLCIHMYKYMLRNSSMTERSACCVACCVEQDIYSDVYIYFRSICQKV